MRTCDRDGCDKPSLIQSISGLCLEHQAEMWKALERVPRLTKEQAEEKKRYLNYCAQNNIPPWEI